VCDGRMAGRVSFARFESSKCISCVSSRKKLKLQNEKLKNGSGMRTFLVELQPETGVAWGGDKGLSRLCPSLTSLSRPSFRVSGGGCQVPLYPQYEAGDETRRRSFASLIIMSRCVLRFLRQSCRLSIHQDQLRGLCLGGTLGHNDAVTSRFTPRACYRRKYAWPGPLSAARHY
jgi:hypothetical protein